MNYSFSSLNLFLQCERRWFYERVQKRPVPSNVFFPLGTLYHACIAAELGNGASADVASIAAVHSKRADWRAASPLHVLVKEIEQNLMRLRRDVFLNIKVIPPLELRIKHDGVTVVLDCVSEWTPTTDAAGYVTGHVDQPCVVDWKVKFSTRERRTQDSVEESAQLALYCLESGYQNAAFVEIPRDVRAPIQTFVSRFPPDDLVRWRRWHDNQRAAMGTRGPDEAAYRLAEPGHKLCSATYCPFFSTCPGGRCDGV